MVSIKSLAVLLFAAAVTAAPLAGDDHHGHGSHGIQAVDHSKTCTGDGQKIYCCDDAKKSGVDGPYSSFLDGTEVRCTNIVPNVVAITGGSSNSQCNAKAACCAGKSTQNGNANVNLECMALAGIN